MLYLLFWRHVCEHRNQTHLLKIYFKSIKSYFFGKKSLNWIWLFVTSFDFQEYYNQTSSEGVTSTVLPRVVRIKEWFSKFYLRWFWWKHWEFGLMRLCYFLCCCCVKVTITVFKFQNSSKLKQSRKPS